MAPYMTSIPRSGYRMERKFGGGKVWQIHSFQAFGERKFDELIDHPIDY